MSACHTYKWACDFCATSDLPVCHELTRFCQACRQAPAAPGAPSAARMKKAAQQLGLDLHFCNTQDPARYCDMSYHCDTERCRVRTQRHVGTTATAGRSVTSYFGDHLPDLSNIQQAAVLCHEMGHNINLKEALGGLDLAPSAARKLRKIRKDALCPSGMEPPAPGGCNHEFLADEVCSRIILPTMGSTQQLVYEVESQPYRYMDTLVNTAADTCTIGVTEAWHVDQAPPARCDHKTYVNHFNHPPVDHE